MNGISHKQAIQLIDRRVDGLLNESQRLLLEEHLRSCESCQAYAVDVEGLSAHLQNEFHRRWDPQSGPSQNVLELVTARAGRIPMTNRFSAGVKLLAGAAALIVLGFLINFMVSQLQNTSTSASATETANNSALAINRLLTFASDQNGNSDIYIMHGDGSGLTNLTNNPAYDGLPFWSPDGKRIAFTSDRDGSIQVYLMNADGSDILQLTTGEGDYQFDGNGRNPWSPDGKKLILSHASPGEQKYKLYLIDVTDQNIMTLTNEPGQYTHPSWSPDGKYIAFIADTGGIPRDLFIIGSDGNGLTKLTEDLPSGEFFMFDYEWSQDGASLFFTTDRNQQTVQEATYTSTVYEARMDGSIVVAAQETDKPIMSWWNGIAVRRESEPRLSWLRPDGSQSTLDLCPENGQLFGVAHKRAFSGNMVVGSNCSDTGWMLYWANPEGTMIRPLLATPVSTSQENLFYMTWSPDDQYLAFVSLDTASPEITETLYVLDVAKAREDPSIHPVKIPNGFGPSWQPVPNDEVVEEKPTPAPTQDPASNDLIAFTSDQNGNFDIYTIHADGSGLTNLTNNPAQDVSPVWSPDGKRIAFESDRNGFRQIFLMDADGSNVIELDENEEEADQWIGEPYNLSLNLWSPDGNKLIFYELALGDEEGMLYIIDADGENKRPLVNEIGKYSSPSWSPDGKHIAFIATENNVARIYITDANGDNLTNVTKALPSNETLYPLKYSWSRNGQSIVFIASNWNYLLGRGNEGTSTYKWTAYEASLDGNTLVTNASADSQMGGYWDGTYFLSGSAAVSSSPEFKWVRSDGTSTTANPIENCQRLLDSNTGEHITGYSSYRQSSHGNVVIGVYCPNGDKWLFWANSKGVFIPLLNSPIHVQSIPSNAMYLWAPPDFIWSSDDQYIAFNIFSSGKTDMYIVNVNDALQNPSTQPFHMAIGNGSLYYSPVWQPMP